ncbi:hypothetical protein EGR_05760 [Echinococcus granulosus]|uniref:Uncharacterized protein n=1 Tax=Echinococcus granulosus TaxID=6210 RepID=W6UES3_ECHGR|nr:hypothetical protein EGR_05760 [Echinococcus granulosus]EUB59406.1 hypothetical protein EGR_05760 [Echinococcus granulosus]
MCADQAGISGLVIDVFPHDIDSIETIQQDADKRPWFLNLHRIRRPDGPPRYRTSEVTFDPLNNSGDLKLTL